MYASPLRRHYWHFYPLSAATWSSYPRSRKEMEAACPSLSARLQGFSDLGERPGSLHELPI